MSPTENTIIYPYSPSIDDHPNVRTHNVGSYTWNTYYPSNEMASRNKILTRYAERKPISIGEVLSVGSHFILGTPENENHYRHQKPYNFTYAV